MNNLKKSSIYYSISYYEKLMLLAVDMFNYMSRDMLLLPKSVLIYSNCLASSKSVLEKI